MNDESRAQSKMAERASAGRVIAASMDEAKDYQERKGDSQ
jgi:hypothetical protein